jgi:hypothetical protein
MSTPYRHAAQVLVFMGFVVSGVCRCRRNNRTQPRGHLEYHQEEKVTIFYIQLEGETLTLDLAAPDLAQSLRKAGESLPGSSPELATFSAEMALHGTPVFMKRDAAANKELTNLFWLDQWLASVWHRTNATSTDFHDIFGGRGMASPENVNWSPRVTLDFDATAAWRMNKIQNAGPRELWGEEFFRVCPDGCARVYLGTAGQPLRGRGLAEGTATFRACSELLYLNWQWLGGRVQRPEVY